MSPRRRKVGVLAGTLKEYKEWKIGHVVSTTLITRIQDCHMVRLSRIIVIGTFWRKKDAQEIYDHAMTRIGR